MLYNPQLLLGIALAFVISIGGAGFQGYRMGVDHEKANEKEKDTLVQEIREAAQESAAKAISQIKIVNRTINTTLEKEINENHANYNCNHTDAGLRAVNDALEGRPSSDSKLPKANSTGG